MVAASTLDKQIQDQIAELNNTEQAKLVGETLAQRAQDRGVKKVVGNRDFANLLTHRSILAGEARRMTNQLLDAIDELSAALAEAT